MNDEQENLVWLFVDAPTLDFWLYWRTWNGREATKNGNASLQLSNDNDGCLPILVGVTNSAIEAVREATTAYQGQRFLAYSAQARKYLSDLQAALPLIGREAKNFPIETELESALAKGFPNWSRQANKVLQIRVKSDKSDASIPQSLTVFHLSDKDDVLERYALAQMLMYPKQYAVIGDWGSRPEANFPLLSRMEQGLSWGKYYLSSDGHFFKDMGDLLAVVYGISAPAADETASASE